MPLWRRWWFRIVCLIVLAIAGMAFNVYWQRREAAEELRQVLAELDQADPDWRLEQSEATRPVLPDDQNGALIVLAASRGLPENREFKSLDGLADALPPVQLRAEALEQLRKELDLLSKPLMEARKLAHYPQGRFKTEFAPDFISTIVKDQTQTRPVGALLQLDVFASLQDGRNEQACESISALLNVGRCLKGEPTLIMMLVRNAVQTIAVQCAERTLGQTTAGESQLSVLQRSFAEESREE